MIELCHGWGHTPLRMSATRKYDPHQVRELCRRVCGPFWLRVESKLIPVDDEECLRLACQVSSAYHDWLAYNAPDDDGFSEDFAEREASIITRMEEEASNAADGHSSEEERSRWR
jgi:hypothetical protein